MLWYKRSRLSFSIALITGVIDDYLLITKNVKLSYFIDVII